MSTDPPHAQEDTTDFSDAYSRRRVWTGPNEALKPRVPSNPHPNIPLSIQAGLAAQNAPLNHYSCTRSGSMTNHFVTRSNSRVFRKPAGGISYGLSDSFQFSSSSNSVAPATPPTNMPLPSAYLGRASTNLKAATRLGSLSFVALDDDEDPSYDESRQPELKENEPNRSSLQCANLNNLGSSSRTLVNALEPATSFKPELNARRLLFRRPGIKSHHRSTKDIFKMENAAWVERHLGFCIESSLFQDALFAYFIARMGAVLGIIPTLALPRFLTILIPSIMTHHTAFIDPDVFFHSYLLPTKCFMIPLRLASVFGLSLSAVSCFNTDTPSSTSFAVFLCVPRLCCFVTALMAVTFEPDAHVRTTLGLSVLWRAAVMVWLPGVFFFVAEFVVQRWIGWRDVMWASGAVAEILAVCVLDSLESSVSFAMTGDIVMQAEWDVNVRQRIKRLVTLVTMATCVISLFPYRSVAESIDSIVTVQFTLGPYIVSLFALLVMYCITWMYEVAQRNEPDLLGFAADCFSRSKSVSRSDTSKGGGKPRKVSISAAPPFAVWWRLLHVPLFAGLIIFGGGFRPILQDMLDQWLGLAGFNPKSPLSFDVTTNASGLNETLSHYLAAASHNVEMYSSAVYTQSTGALWDFSQPRLWCSIGLVVILTSNALISLTASMSFARIINDQMRLQTAETSKSLKLPHKTQLPTNDTDRYICDTASFPQPPIQKTAKKERTPSSNWSGTLNKTQSMVHFSSYNNRASKQSFTQMKTPTPSLITMPSSSSSKNTATTTPAVAHMTALENDLQFWQELLESSPVNSPHNSIGHSKSHALSPSALDELSIIATPPGKSRSKVQPPPRHVSISVEEAPKKHRRVWTKASVAASVTEDKPTAATVVEFKESSAAQVFDANLAPVLEGSSKHTQQTSSLKSFTRLLWLHLFIRLCIAGLFVALIPGARYLAPVLAPVIGNLGNEIDVFSYTSAEPSNDGGIVDGARWKLVENSEAIIILCGQSCIMFIACIAEEVAYALRMRKHGKDVLSEFCEAPCWKENRV
ncbi:hypothetical protein HDU77_000368 [Chytriomyces hyalinus]|nr:hypothetical protein HDU77_000368 [Chytriomyces hyalinus]